MSIISAQFELRPMHSRLESRVSNSKSMTFVGDCFPHEFKIFFYVENFLLNLQPRKS